MRYRKSVLLSAAVLGLALQSSVPPLPASVPEEQPRPRQQFTLPAVVLEYLEKNYGLTEEWLKLSRWIPQTRPELLAGPPHRSALADLPLPAGYSSTTTGARLVFPQVADGSLGAGGKFYQTLFALSGNPFLDASGTIEFFQDNGAPMSLTLNGVNGSSFPVSLKKGELKRLATSGSGELKVGWARILTDQPIVGGVSFGIRDAAGTIYADVGVDEAAVGKDFTLFADTKGDFDTGIALVNPSPSESITLRLELFRSDGSSMGVEPVILPPLGHTARFVSQLFSRIAGIAEFEGSIRITGEKFFCGTTLRIVGDQMTTLPMLLTNAEFDEYLYLPQVANGSSPAAGIRYATTLVIFNHSAVRVTGVVRFHATDGTPLNLVLGGSAGNEFPFEIAAKGVLRLTSDASGAIQTGWAEVIPYNDGVQAAAVFHVQDLSGRLITEVGVQGILRSKQFRLAADTLGPFDTGLAIANTDSSNSAGIQLILYDSAGVKKGEYCLALGPQQHTAVFLTQLFRDVAGIGEFSGFLMVTGSRSLGVLSLRAVEEKLTSVPAVRSKLGFRPLSVMSLLQEASGASPAVRWQIRANGLDLAVSRATFSAPALGLRLDRVREKMPFAAGFIYGDNVAGLFQGLIMSMVDMIFADKVTGDSIEFDFQQLHGKLSGTPTSGLKLELTTVDPPDPGSTTIATDLDLDLLLPAGIVTTPAGMRSTNIVTEFISVPVSAEYLSDELTCTIRQTHPLTPADPAKAQIVNLEPHFLFPGAMLKITGVNLGSQPRIFFRMSNGSDVEADLLDLTSGVMSVQVPLSGIPTEIRVDSGTGAGLPVKVQMPFAPTFELWSATRVGGASTPFSFIFRQEARQLAIGGFETTIYGVDINLAALTPGTVVGDSWMTGGPTAAARAGLWNLKVESAAAGTAVLTMVPLGKEDPAARLRLEKVTDRFTGVRMTYAPVTAAGSGGLSLSFTAQYFAAELIFNFNGVPLILPAAGKRVFGGVAIDSLPFGAGKPPLTVQRSFSFKTVSGTPQLLTTTTTAPPPASTTTTFPCQAGSLPTTTSTTTIVTTTVRPTTTTSSSTSSTIRVTTSTTSTTIRITTTTSSSTTSTTIRPTTTTTTLSASTTTSTRPVTTTTLPSGACNLFADDFNRGNFSGWDVVPGPGAWQVLNGMLQIIGLTAGDEALILRSNLPTPHFFELNVDLQSLNFTGPYYGFQPFSDTLEFNLSSGLSTDGIGAGVDASGSVGFLVFDLNAGEYKLLEKQSYGAVQSVGIRYSATGITLIVNGTPRLIISANFSSPPAMQNLGLAAAGPGILRFDNVCQTALVPVATEEAGRIQTTARSVIQLRAGPRSPGLSRRPKGGR